ncbi:MAG: DUF1573 domain-containing protein [Bacteroidales bacterium]|nr:DUF1573 domain-containing protein [Bacteroidales bacterium]
MKAVFLSIFAMSVLGLVAQPRVKWVNTRADIGIIREADGPVTVPFRVVNLGPGEASVTDTRGACACTMAVAQKGAIAKGDTTTVNVTFNPRNFLGFIEKKVHATVYGEPNNATLVIQGYVIAKDSTIMRKYPYHAAGALWLKSDTIDFGTLGVDGQRTVYLDAYNASLEPIRLTFPTLPAGIEAPEGVLPAAQALAFPVKIVARKGMTGGTLEVAPGVKVAYRVKVE